jgi:acyl-CoA reductase-like NAD-dependent aldehyde dehydrogenase
MSELGSHFYEPTVLTGVREGMRVLEEEKFALSPHSYVP